jgi:hypothetical protein
MAKTATEQMIITQEHAPEVSKWLLERLTPEEKDTVLGIFLNKEIRQKLAEVDKKGKEVQGSIESYGKSVEKRILNRIVAEEIKQQVLARRSK